MRIRCSKKWCTNQETCSKREPEWEPKFAPGPLASRRRGVLKFGHSLRVSFPHAPFPRSRSGFCSILFFSRRIPSWIPPFPSLVGRFLATFWQHFAHFWLKVGCRVFVMFFLSVFGRFLMRFWLVFGVDFTCFSHPCSNCVFAYFFLGCFLNVCTLSKHGIFKRHCFSRVKTLFWRNRLCRKN